MCKKEEEKKIFRDNINSVPFPAIPVSLTTHLPTFAVHTARSLCNITLLLFFFFLAFCSVTQQEYLGHKGTENKIK